MTSQDRAATEDGTAIRRAQRTASTWVIRCIHLDGGHRGLATTGRGASRRRGAAMASPSMRG